MDKRYAIFVIVMLAGIFLLVALVFALVGSDEDAGGNSQVGRSGEEYSTASGDESEAEGLTGSENDSATGDEGVDTDGVNGDGSDETGGMADGGAYVDYDPAFLQAAEYGNVVLFFHASWCPSCKTLEADINNNLTEIPNDMVIMKIDYDDSSELKQKYGVTVQHTLVQVDSQGAQLKKWIGSLKLADVVSQAE